MNIKNNAINTSKDILFVFLWVGAWGVTETLMDFITKQPVKRVGLYAGLFLLTFIAFLFVSHETVT